MAKNRAGNRPKPEGDASGPFHMRQSMLMQVAEAGWFPSCFPEDVDFDEVGAWWLALRHTLPVELQSALIWPEKPRHLSEADWLGIRVMLARLRFAGRFLAGRKLGGQHLREAQESERAVGCIAAFWVLTQVRTPKQLNVLASRNEEFRALARWDRDVLGPSVQRLRSRKLEVLTPEAVLEIEPARTLARLTIEGGIVDIEADRRAMARALEVFTGGRKRARACAPLSAVELFDAYQFITRGERCITSFGPAGSLVVQELDAKSALDSDAGPVLQTKRNHDGEMRAEEQEDPRARAAFDALAAQDAIAAIETLVQQMREKAGWTPTQQIALDVAIPLLKGEVTVVEVARGRGVPKTTLQSAWEHVRSGLRTLAVAKVPGLAAMFAQQ